MYRARLQSNGQEVAVKVQRPGALATISKVQSHADLSAQLALLMALAQFALCLLLHEATGSEHSVRLKSSRGSSKRCSSLVCNTTCLLLDHATRQDITVCCISHQSLCSIGSMHRKYILLHARNLYVMRRAVGVYEGSIWCL